MKILASLPENFRTNRSITFSPVSDKPEDFFDRQSFKYNNNMDPRLQYNNSSVLSDNSNIVSLQDVINGNVPEYSSRLGFPMIRGIAGSRGNTLDDYELKNASRYVSPTIEVTAGVPLYNFLKYQVPLWQKYLQQYNPKDANITYELAPNDGSTVSERDKEILYNILNSGINDFSPLFGQESPVATPLPWVETGRGKQWGWGALKSALNEGRVKVVKDKEGKTKFLPEGTAGITYFNERLNEPLYNYNDTSWENPNLKDYGSDAYTMTYPLGWDTNSLPSIKSMGGALKYADYKGNPVFDDKGNYKPIDFAAQGIRLFRKANNKDLFSAKDKLADNAEQFIDFLNSDVLKDTITGGDVSELTDTQNKFMNTLDDAKTGRTEVIYDKDHNPIGLRDLGVVHNRKYNPKTYSWEGGLEGPQGARQKVKLKIRRGAQTSKANIGRANDVSSEVKEARQAFIENNPLSEAEVKDINAANEAKGRIMNAPGSSKDVTSAVNISKSAKSFVKNMFDFDNHPENKFILDEHGITENDKDALKTMLMTTTPSGVKAYGKYWQKYSDPSERLSAILKDYKSKGSIDNASSASAASLGAPGKPNKVVLRLKTNKPVIEQTTEDNKSEEPRNEE